MLKKIKLNYQQLNVEAIDVIKTAAIDSINYCLIKYLRHDFGILNLLKMVVNNMIIKTGVCLSPFHYRTHPITR